MPLTANTLIAGRYRLLEQLGAGGMGEVWKALDERFEVPRPVAIKLLREDESLLEDRRNRESLARILQQEARDGLTPELVVRAFEDALHSGPDSATLRRFVLRELESQSELTTEFVLSVFDTLANNPSFNDNARVRERLRKLFRDEANSVGTLRHDNIVSTFDTGLHEGLPFLVMDYIEGKTLSRIIQRGERLSRARQLRLMEDLCEGLSFAHRRQFVHRDIKPANLIIDASTGRLKVLDFGIVKRLERVGEATSSGLGGPVGTLCYMSPEQTRGSASLDARSDIFAVGAVFYELLTGRKAFPANGTLADLFARIQNRPPTPLDELCPELPSEIARIVYRALEKDPSRRYQDLGRMKREIEKVRMRIELEDESADAADETEIGRPGSAGVVGDLLIKAQSAYGAGDDAEAIKLCNQALRVEPDLTQAGVLLGKARQRRTQKQVDQWLSEARQLLERGDFTGADNRVAQAVSLQPASSGAADLGRAIQDARLRLAAERAGAARIADLLELGRASLDAGRYDAALAAALEIEELDAENGSAHELRLAAERGIEEARRLALEASVEDILARADLEIAAGRFEQAVAILGRFTPEHPRVSARLLEAREALNRKTRSDALHREARALFDGGRFPDVIARLDEAASLRPDDPESRRLRDAAVAALEHEEREAQQVRDADERTHAAERLRAQGRLSDGLREVRRALTDRPGHPTAKALEQRLERDIAEQEHAAYERRVAAGIEEARRAFGQRQYEQAFALLAGIEPSHPRATAAARELQAELAKLEAQARDILAAAAALFEAARFDEALASLAEVEGWFPAKPEVLALRRSIQQRLDLEAQVSALLADAEHALEQGRLEQADERVVRALALDPASAVAVDLRERIDRAREHVYREAVIARAQASVEEARRQFSARAYDEGIATLQRVDPPHELVTAELERLRTELESIRSRGDAVASAVREALGRKDFARAGTLVAELDELLPGNAACVELKRGLQDGLDRRVKVDRLVEQAGVELRKERFDRAGSAVAKALEQESDYAPAIELQHRVAEALAARERAELDRQARQVVQRAAALAVKRRYDRALALLEAFQPPHEDVSLQIRRLRAEAEQRAEQQARTPAPRRRASRGAILAAAIGLMLTLGLGTTWFAYSRLVGDRTGSGTPNPRSTGEGTKGNDGSPEQKPPVTTLMAVPVPVSIDAQPWARIRISTDSPDLSVPREALETPVSIALAPGTYTLELEYIDMPGSVKEQIEVQAGKPNSFPFTRPRFNAERLINDLLGPER